MAEIWAAIVAGRIVMIWTPGIVWPGTLLPLLFVAVVAILRGMPRRVLGLEFGSVRGHEWWIASIAAISAAALILWLNMFPGWPTQVARRLIPDLSGPGLVLIGGLFALANAAAEEVLWRGFLQSMLMHALNRPLWALLLQAASFGAVHYRGGIPNGVTGLVMAAAYGVMLGLLRRCSRGLLAPWVAHVAADSVIFVYLARLVGKL